MGLDALCTNRDCARRCWVVDRSRHAKRFWRAKISRSLRTSEANDGHHMVDSISHHTTLSTGHRVTMAAFRIALRSARAIARLEPCIMCQSHQLALAIRRNATRYPTSSCDFATSMRVQNYATKQRIDAPRLRADVDARGRLGFYTLTKHERIHKIEPRTAMSIYDDFVAHKNTMSHGKNVLRIVNSGCYPHTYTRRCY